MAEVFLGAVTESLVSMAFSLATEELSLVWRFKDDLENLAEELGMIRDLIAEADSKNIQSAPLQHWMKRLKSVAFDVEDVLEEYQYELLRRKVKKQQKERDNKVRCFFSPMKKLAFRLDIGRKIKDVNRKLKNVKDQAKDYGLTPSELLSTSSENKIMDHRMTSPFVQETEIVGRDNDVKKVVDMLFNAKNEENLAVIGIVGVGGQGKTTLAQLIYKNDKVVNHFQQKIWVCVSNDFKIERILNEMVQSISGVNPNLTNREALVKKLQETLKDKRYLLVLDDVWNEDQEKWEDMKKDLQAIGGSIGSKVMVTTRNEKVVKTMHASHTHPLSKLSDVDSWALFKNRAFANGGPEKTPRLEDIGRKMVERCGGMPLAIKALGGLLYSKKNIDEWLNIEKSGTWSSSNSEGVLPSIKLSYSHLSSPSLKQCFAYCSIFPKDDVIYREDLVQLWMAQGFLNPPKGSPSEMEEMEELGDAYFSTLLWNSLLQEPQYDYYHNKIVSCKMHDIVHDFALIISKDYCFTMKVEQDDKSIEAVHLSVISEEERLIDLSQGICSKLRTLYLPNGVVNNELLKFKSLRTLVLGDSSIQELPISIGRLKQLRYLDILYSRITKLPASYVKLYNLQTLKIFMAEGSSIFLGSLINLRHIDDYSDNVCELVGINKLIHLQTLPYFTVEEIDGCKIEELGPLNNLRGRLTIYGLEKVKDREEAQKANIIGKPKVDHLELCWPRMREEASELGNDEDVLEGLRPHSYLKQLTIRGYRGSRFPSWMTNELLQNLVEFTLEGCDSFEQFSAVDHLPSLRSIRIESCNKLVALHSRCFELCTSLTSIEIRDCNALAQGVDDCGLERLPNLEHLSIGKLSKEVDYFPWPPNSSTEKSYGVDAQLYFPSLKKLKLSGWPKLMSLPDQLQYLPSLRWLEIFHFDGLEALPEWLGSVQTLQSLSLYDCENLKYLPSAEAMQRLTNLQRLVINGCPFLRGKMHPRKPPRVEQDCPYSRH